jgi:asparagine synthase (glutamine-hydrolysing)
MDHLLVEWAARLPPSFRVRGQESKWLLKKTLEPMLPSEVLYRRKMGFAIPAARWLAGPLFRPLKEALLGPHLRETGWFDHRFIQRLLDQHQGGEKDHSTALWSLWMFEAFLRKVVNVTRPLGPMHHGA